MAALCIQYSSMISRKITQLKVPVLSQEFGRILYGTGSPQKSSIPFLRIKEFNIPQQMCQNFSSSSLHKQKFHEVTFTRTDGSEYTVPAEDGDTILDVVNNKNLDFLGFGACEGTLSCSTCQVIFSQEDFDKIKDNHPIAEEEQDMLDLAHGVTDTSRLGCQICISEKLKGSKILVPDETADARDADN